MQQKKAHNVFCLLLFCSSFVCNCLANSNEIGWILAKSIGFFLVYSCLASSGEIYRVLAKSIGFRFFPWSTEPGPSVRPYPYITLGRYIPKRIFGRFLDRFWLGFLAGKKTLHKSGRGSGRSPSRRDGSGGRSPLPRQTETNPKTLGTKLKLVLLTEIEENRFRNYF